MTAAELFTADQTFAAFIRHWEQQKRLPLEVVDYLLESGEETLAEAARWAAEIPKRPDYFHETGPRYLYPIASGLHYGYHFWSSSNDTSGSLDEAADYARDYGEQDGKHGGYFSTVVAALLAALDGRVDYRASREFALKPCRPQLPNIGKRRRQKVTDAEAIDEAVVNVGDLLGGSEWTPTQRRLLRDELDMVAAVAADNEFDRFLRAIEEEADRYDREQSDGDYDCYESPFTAADALRKFARRRQAER